MPRPPFFERLKTGLEEQLAHLREEQVDLLRIQRMAQEAPGGSDEEDVEGQIDQMVDMMGGDEGADEEADPFAGIGDEEDAEFEDEVDAPAEEVPEEGAEEVPEEEAAPEDAPAEDAPAEGEGGEEGDEEEAEETPPPRTMMFDKPMPGRDPDHDKKPSDAWKYEDNLDSPMSRWLGGSSLERFAGMAPADIYQG